MACTKTQCCSATDGRDWNSIIPAASTWGDLVVAIVSPAIDRSVEHQGAGHGKRRMQRFDSSQSCPGTGCYGDWSSASSAGGQ